MTSFLRTFSLASAAVLTAALLVSCEYWENWIDRDKPEPETGILHGGSEHLDSVYTRQQAVSLAAAKLIMRFSRLTEKPYVAACSADVMATGLLNQLYRSNVLAGTGAVKPEMQITIHSVFDRADIWHPVVYRVKNGQKIILLDEPFQLKD